MKNYDIVETDEYINSAVNVLLKYNTRENYREIEVSSDTIFQEIFKSWKIDSQNTDKAKEIFYAFFQADTVYFCEVEKTLDDLSRLGIKMGFLTDVAYGMDNRFSLKDIASIIHFFDICLTSVDVGFRKPNDTGLKILRIQRTVFRLTMQLKRQFCLPVHLKDLPTQNWREILMDKVFHSACCNGILVKARYNLYCSRWIIIIIK